MNHATTSANIFIAASLLNLSFGGQVSTTWVLIILGAIWLATGIFIDFAESRIEELT